MESVELTGEEFRNIWNAKCSLGHILYKLEDVLSASLLRDLRAIKKDVDDALARPIAMKDEEDERRNQHYNAVKAEIGCSTVWSIYSVSNLKYPHPHQNACKMIYQGKEMDITNCVTWCDLWLVADKLIKASGDTHHVYIEGFHPKDALHYSDVLELQTGS